MAMHSSEFPTRTWCSTISRLWPTRRIYIRSSIAHSFSSCTATTVKICKSSTICTGNIIKLSRIISHELEGGVLVLQICIYVRGSNVYLQINTRRIYFTCICVVFFCVLILNQNNKIYNQFMIAFRSTDLDQ